jgi:hypothetical protein
MGGRVQFSFLCRADYYSAAELVPRAADVNRNTILRVRSHIMGKRLALPTLLLMLVSGCQSGPPFIDQMQATAVDMAQRQGAFELNCPSATAQVLTSQNLEPLVNTWRWSGPERAEYNVGVSGCGKRVSYIVVCPDNGSHTCYTAGSRAEVQTD